MTSPPQFPTQHKQPQGSIRFQHKGQQGQQQQQQQQCGATQRSLPTSTEVASARSSLYGRPISSNGDQDRSGISPGSQPSGSSQLRPGWSMNISAQEQRRKSFLYGFGWRWDGPSYLSLYSPKSSKLPPETGSTAGEGGEIARHASAEQERMSARSGPGNDTSGAAPRKSAGDFGVLVGWTGVDPPSSSSAETAAAVASAGKVKGMGGTGADGGSGGHMKNATGNVTATATTAAAHTNDTMTGLTGGKVRKARSILHIQSACCRRRSSSLLLYREKLTAAVTKCVYNTRINSNNSLNLLHLLRAGYDSSLLLYEFKIRSVLSRLPGMPIYCFLRARLSLKRSFLLLCDPVGKQCGRAVCFPPLQYTPVYTRWYAFIEQRIQRHTAVVCEPTGVSTVCTGI